MKTMPDSSVSVTAAWLIFSGSISASISCWSRIGRAWLTVIRRVCVCLGMIFSNMLWRSISICSKLPAPRIETGAIDRPGNRDLDLAVLELAGQQPALHLLARPLAALGGLVGLVRVGLAASSWAGARARAGRAAAARPAALACSSTVSRSALRTSRIAASTRSRIRPSTSRPYVADLGVLGGLGLHERCAHEHGQPAGDLGLAHAGRADQHDVLGRDLRREVVGQLPPPPPIAQGDRHGPLGVGLADDVAVQLGDDLPGGQLGLVLRHGNSSTLGLPSLKHAYENRRS